MFVLVLDTSTPAVTAAAVEIAGSGQVAVSAERVGADPRRHGELLAPAVQAVLRDAGLAPADLAAVVAGVGPGPYTGLRIGLVTAAALGDALAIPTYAVCSLDAIAYAAPPASGPVLVAADARRREVYWATYDGQRTRLTGPAVDRPGHVDTAGCTLACGAGAVMYADVLGLPTGPPQFPPAAALAALAAARVTGRAPAERLTPLYLRRPDATEPAPAKAVRQ